MQSSPLWPVSNRFPKLTENTQTDVVIAGAGIAGMAAAYFLKEKGFDVMVIEKDEVGCAATGASSGILYYGSGMNFGETTQRIGKNKTELLWKETRQSMQEMRKLAEKNGFSCGFTSNGAIMAAASETQTGLLETEQKELHAQGIPSRMLSSQEIRSHYTGSAFDSGLFFPEVIQLHPAQFCSELAHAFRLPVFEQTPLIGFKEEKEKVVVRTPSAQVKATHLVLATNLTPFFDWKENVSEESSAILASRPLNREQMKKTWPNPTILWTMGEEYDLIYPTPDQRLVLEVFRLREIAQKLSAYYPAGFQKDIQWGDSWLKTTDTLPLAGLMSPRVGVCTALGDQGIVSGFSAGRHWPRILEQKTNPFTEMISPKRFTVQ